MVIKISFISETLFKYSLTASLYILIDTSYEGKNVFSVITVRLKSNKKFIKLNSYLNAFKAKIK